MTPPTHIALALALGQFSGAGPAALKLLALGSILPDIDHPRSTIGRLLLFLSIPLNRWSGGHRKSIHGFFLWGLVALGGIYWRPALFIGLGALSHCFFDCWTVSGVQALEPFSERVCVLFRRKFRIVSGSRQELFFLFILGLAVWAGFQLEAAGGVRAVLGDWLGSYQLAYERYLRAGPRVCHIEGELRLTEGEIISGRWLVIGKEKSQGLAVLKDDKVLHLPKDGHFLRCKLDVDPSQEWATATVRGLAETGARVFQLQRGRWVVAEKGELVAGTIIGRRIEIDQNGDLYNLFTNEGKTTDLGPRVGMDLNEIVSFGASERI